MLRTNWLQSRLTIKPSQAARDRVWEVVVETAQPVGIMKVMSYVAWLFATPVRTSVFAVCLFMAVLSGGYLIPNHLEQERFVQVELQLDQEIPSIEQEIMAELAI